MALGDLNIRIGGTIEGLVKAMNAAERRLRRDVRKFEQIGNNLSSAISIPLAAAGGAGLKFAFDLDKSFSKIENLVGISGAALDELKTGVQGLSGPLGAAQGELADALFTITSAGARGSAALQTLEQASKASTIGLGNTTDIARAATAVVNNYGEAVINASTAIDQFTAAARVGNFNTEEFAPSIGKVLPLAKTLGISFAQVAANVATFTKGGLSAKESITGLKSLLSNIVKPTKQTKEALAQVGVTVEGLQASIKQKGLAATLVELVKLYDGNTEALSKVIPNVEGLVNALSVAGSQGEDYIENLQQIENATGIVDKGFKNASEGGAFKLKQALVALQNVSIDLGNILVPIATKIIQRFTDLVSTFSSLDPAIKKIAVAFGVLLAAIGPVFKGLAALKNLQLAYIQVSKSMILGIKKLSGSVLVLTSSFQKLNLATKASVIGALVAAVVGAIAVFQKYNKQLTTAQKIQQSLNKIEVRAAQSIAAEKVQLELLSRTLNDANASRKNQARALKELQQISPEYFSGLALEKSQLSDINAALDAYINNIERRAKLQAANERLVEIEKELLDTQQQLENAEPGFWETAKNAALSFGSAQQFAVKQTQSQVKSFKASTDALEAEKNKLLEYIGAAKSATVARKELSVPTAAPTLSGLSGPVAPVIDEEALAAERAALTQKLKFLAEVKARTQEVTAANSALAGALEKVTEGEIKVAESITIANIKAREQNERLADLADRGKEFAEGLSIILEDSIKGLAVGIGESIGNLASGFSNLSDIGKKALSGLADVLINVGKLAIQTGIAITGIIQSFKLNPALAIAGGAALVALGSLVKNKLSKSAEPPALAAGGLAFGPTTAIVGDNANARVNPEVIAPLDKLKKYMNGGRSQIDLNGIFTARGNDLALILDRTNYNKSRIGG